MPGLSMETDLAFPGSCAGRATSNGDRPIHAQRVNRSWYSADYAAVVDRAGRLGRALGTGRYEPVDEIPKIAVGKFEKTALRERFTS